MKIDSVEPKKFLLSNIQLLAGEDDNPDSIIPDDPGSIDPAVDENVEENMEQDIDPIDQQAPGDSQEPPTQQTLKINIGNEEREFSLEDITQLAQRGLGFDSLQEQLNQYQNNPGLQYLNELANRNGRSVEELVNYWRQSEEEQMINELIQNNIPEEYAREMIESRKFRAEVQQREQQRKNEDNMRNQQMEFMQAFPDVQPKDIPQEVWDKANQGMPLKNAYMEYDYKLLKEKIKTLETTINNKKKAVVKGIGTFGNDDPGEEDLFLKGFNS